MPNIWNFLKKNEKIIIWLSGGPDSIFLFYLIYDFFLSQKRNLENIIVCSLDHGLRLESQLEIYELSKFCKERWVFFETAKFENQISKKTTENQLRNRRHKKFLEFATKHNTKKIFLWHNLTDRFETMILNMCRWSLNNWIISIRQIQKHWLDPSFTIIRPLIELPKEQIIQICDEKKIKYFLDKSNLDNTVSQRNIIRNIKEK